MPSPDGPSFLKRKYDLHKSEEVERTVAREEAYTGERISQKPADRIQTYLDRLSVILNPNPIEGLESFDRKGRNIAMLERALHAELIVHPDVATDEYLIRQKNIARAQGHGNIEIPTHLVGELKVAVTAIRNGAQAQETLDSFPNEQEQIAEEIIALLEEQERSLDTWLEYLASSDATYPDWLKYWSFRSITQLSSYDKDEKCFSKRTERTINPFPDLNREALAYVLDAVEKKYGTSEEALVHGPKTQDETRFDKLLQGESFPKLYAWAMEKVTPASVELLATTAGKWVKYDQSSDHLPLVASLQNHGTGWCTAGETTAESQLSRGDFYVYYSLNADGKPTIPRAAIRMEDDHIAEVRGIAKDQNLDSYIAPIVKAKMVAFPDGMAYMRKADDMQRLTQLEQKTKQNDPLTKDDLIFLYEIDHTIDGFGYERDPRIAELLAIRNSKEDAPIVLGCTPDEIAWTKDTITDQTKAYIGQLFRGIFSDFPNLDHLYAKFPGEKIERRTIEIGGRTTKELEQDLEAGGYGMSDYTRDILAHQVTISKKQQDVNLVLLTVSDLGFTQDAHYDEIIRRAEELGLERCPAEVGPHLRLAMPDQPMDDLVTVAMKPLTHSDLYPSVFGVGRSAGGRWLFASHSAPVDGWDPYCAFVFIRGEKH